MAGLFLAAQFVRILVMPRFDRDPDRQLGKRIPVEVIRRLRDFVVDNESDNPFFKNNPWSLQQIDQLIAEREAAEKDK